MANVTVAPAYAAPDGTTVGSAAQAMSASDNYIIRNNGRLLLLFIKTGAGDATITIVTPGTVGGLAIAEQTFTVPATTGVVVAGPFPPGIYNDASGDLDVSTDEDTNLTMYVLSLP